MLVTMKIGVTILTYGPQVGPEDFDGWAQLAERLGFHFMMITDHVTMTPQLTANFPPPFYDPFTTLAWLAGRTSTIELGTTVAVLPYRHPLNTARIAASIDRFSGGRLIFGVGIGWSKQEYAALGVDFTRRGRITDEYLTCVLEHWDQPVVSFHGRYADYADITTAPAPVRRPPIWVGGLADAALRRAARFGDAWHPYGLDAATIRERLPVLRAAAEREGREMPALAPRIALHPTDRPVEGTDRVPGHGTLEQIHEDVAEMVALGVTHLLLDPFLAVFLDAAPADPFPTNDPHLLQMAAEKIVDLAGGTVR
jgi:probable F420-dependent oxidoreductase